jgi:hypothetical protein
VFLSHEDILSSEMSCLRGEVHIAAPTTQRPTPTTRRPTPTTRAASNCHPSYQGECLKVGIGDYDCAGGSGNGPNYVQGTVRVVGPDEFDLDRDGDGWGCEA